MSRLREAEDRLIEAGGAKYSHALIASAKARSEILRDISDKAVTFGLTKPDIEVVRPQRTKEEMQAGIKEQIDTMQGLLAALERSPGRSRKGSSDKVEAQ